MLATKGGVEKFIGLSAPLVDPIEADCCRSARRLGKPMDSLRGETEFEPNVRLGMQLPLPLGPLGDRSTFEIGAGKPLEGTKTGGGGGGALPVPF